jgi:L-cysteine:1D-myo-inositol 2-amino-2-deoxy-alpha-D-glucopyranoside ligase
MKIFDTSKQSVVDFTPSVPVKIYCCGITPYDAAHMGHAAVYLTFDIVRRRLEDMGVETRCVRNVTDVDDDILRRSRELGVHYLDLAAEEMHRFDKDMSALGLLPPTSEPRATSAIPMILNLVDRVLENGHAYRANGSVYFDVSSFPDFGGVSHFSRNVMMELAAERGGHVDDPAKRDPLDFVLWQPSMPGEPEWESRWGPGRPGWHIECSALALRELGTVDLHGGGSDLVFPHHECESAQAEAATGRPFCKYWMHVGMVGLDGVKMSKSLGNLVFVHDLLEQWDPMVVRLAVISNHYRSDWDWNDQMLEEAAERLDRWRSAGEGDLGIEEVRDCLDNDLDVPGAVDALDRAAGSGGVSVPAARLLGVNY